MDKYSVTIVAYFQTEGGGVIEAARSFSDVLFKVAADATDDSFGTFIVKELLKVARIEAARRKKTIRWIK